MSTISIELRRPAPSGNQCFRHASDHNGPLCQISVRIDDLSSGQETYYACSSHATTELGKIVDILGADERLPHRLSDCGVILRQKQRAAAVKVRRRHIVVSLVLEMVKIITMFVFSIFKTNSALPQRISMITNLLQSYNTSDDAPFTNPPPRGRKHEQRGHNDDTPAENWQNDSPADKRGKGYL